MQNLVEIHLKPQPLASYGLPNIAYPVPTANLQAALADNGELPLAVILHGLQQRSRDGGPIGSRSSPRWTGWHSCWRPMTIGRSFLPPATTGGSKSDLWISTPSWSRSSVVTP